MQTRPAHLIKSGSVSEKVVPDSVSADGPGASSLSISNSSTNGKSKATISLDGQTTKLNNPTHYKHTFKGSNSTLNVSISDHSSSSPSNISSQSTSTVTVNTRE